MSFLQTLKVGWLTSGEIHNNYITIKYKLTRPGVEDEIAGILFNSLGWVSHLLNSLKFSSVPEMNELQGLACHATGSR